jgi:genome maintenance exonuclease 1
MSVWNEQQFPITSYTAHGVPACTITYTPLTLSLPITETLHDGKRWYLYDGQLFPSISNLISATDDEGRKSLQQWRQRVGHAAATSITEKAASRGTRWHKFCEYFVTRQQIGWSLFEEPEDVAYGAHIATVLNTQLRAVVASETRVASTAYGIAGRMDMAVELQDGRHAILDFKTGKKRKSGNRLDNYAIQGTFYADALTEHWGRGPIDTVVIAQLLPDRILWQETEVAQWRESLRTRVDMFAQQVNTVLG